MNAILKPFQRKLIFDVFFFYNILVYSSTLELQLNHLSLILEKLKDNQPFSKRLKCSIFEKEVEYLRHVIFEEEVVMQNS
jgi:hypothetical protein